MQRKNSYFDLVKSYFKQLETEFDFDKSSDDKKTEELQKKLFVELSKLFTDVSDEKIIDSLEFQKPTLACYEETLNFLIKLSGNEHQKNKKFILLFLKKFLAYVPQEYMYQEGMTSKYMTLAYQEGSTDTVAIMTSYYALDQGRRQTLNSILWKRTQDATRKKLIINNMTALDKLASFSQLQLDYYFESLKPDLLKEKKSTNYRGRNILHIAIERSFIDVIKYILENECEDLINQQDNEGNTPLHIAAQMVQNSSKISTTSRSLNSSPVDFSKTQQEVIQLLIKKGADKDITNHLGKTAQDLYKSKDTDIHNMLQPTRQSEPREKKTSNGIENAILAKRSELITACEEHNFSLIADGLKFKEYYEGVYYKKCYEYFILLIQGTKLTEDKDTLKQKWGQTALKYLIDALQCIPRACFDIKSGEEDTTILNTALLKGSVEAFNFVIKTIPPKQINRDNLEQLALSASTSSTPVNPKVWQYINKDDLDFMLEWSAKPSSWSLYYPEFDHAILNRVRTRPTLPTDVFGNTALHIAVKKNIYEAVKTLLTHWIMDDEFISPARKYHANLTNKKDETPLQIAISQKTIDLRIIDLLIQHGATYKETKQKDTYAYINPLVLAEINKYTSLSQYMLYLNNNPYKKFDSKVCQFFFDKDSHKKEYAFKESEHPLFIALKREDITAIEWMLDNGLDLTYTTSKYPNFLIMALKLLETKKEKEAKDWLTIDRRTQIIDLLVKKAPQLLTESALAYFETSQGLFSSVKTDLLEKHRTPQKITTGSQKDALTTDRYEHINSDTPEPATDSPMITTEKTLPERDEEREEDTPFSELSYVYFESKKIDSKEDRQPHLTFFMPPPLVPSQLIEIEEKKGSLYILNELHTFKTNLEKKKPSPEKKQKGNTFFIKYEKGVNIDLFETISDIRPDDEITLQKTWALIQMYETVLSDKHHNNLLAIIHDAKGLNFTTPIASQSEILIHNIAKMLLYKLELEGNPWVCFDKANQLINKEARLKDLTTALTYYNKLYDAVMLQDNTIANAADFFEKLVHYGIIKKAEDGYNFIEQQLTIAEESGMNVVDIREKYQMLDANLHLKGTPHARY